MQSKILRRATATKWSSSKGENKTKTKKELIKEVETKFNAAKAAGYDSYTINFTNCDKVARRIEKCGYKVTKGIVEGSFNISR